MQEDDVRPHLDERLVHNGWKRGDRHGGWCGDRGRGTQGPRTEPRRHALTEQEREAETGAVMRRIVAERDPP